MLATEGFFPIGGVVPKGANSLQASVGPAGLEGGTGFFVVIWVMAWRTDGDGFHEAA